MANEPTTRELFNTLVNGKKRPGRPLEKIKPKTSSVYLSLDTQYKLQTIQLVLAQANKKYMSQSDAIIHAIDRLFDTLSAVDIAEIDKINKIITIEYLAKVDPRVLAEDNSAYEQWKDNFFRVAKEDGFESPHTHPEYRRMVKKVETLLTKSGK